MQLKVGELEFNLTPTFPKSIPIYIFAVKYSKLLKKNAVTCKKQGDTLKGYR